MGQITYFGDSADYERQMNDAYNKIEAHYIETYCQTCSRTTHHSRESGLCMDCLKKERK